MSLNFLFLKVLQYLLDDVSDFLSSQSTLKEGKREIVENEPGCHSSLKAFIDHISEREKANFCARRLDNKSSVALTTIHQVLSCINFRIVLDLETTFY